jgi:hypothetical protein
LPASSSFVTPEYAEGGAGWRLVTLCVIGIAGWRIVGASGGSPALGLVAMVAIKSGTDVFWYRRRTIADAARRERRG